jgi:hypothetical protein
MGFQMYEHPDEWEECPLDAWRCAVRCWSSWEAWRVLLERWMVLKGAIMRHTIVALGMFCLQGHGHMGDARVMVAAAHCTGRPSSGARVGSGLLCMSLQVFACHGHTRFHCVTSIWKKSEICAMFVTNDHTIVHKHD